MEHIFNEKAERYHINGFKHFSALAMEYFPRLSSQSSASRKMRASIEEKEELLAELKTVHYTHRTVDVSPEMQLVLYRHWGPPKVDLPIDPTTEHRENV